MSTHTLPDVVSLAPRRTAAMVLRSARPRQWLKNVLVFAAPAAAGQLLERSVAVRATAMAAAFVLAASATYLVNDVVDAEADRRHPTKRDRPIAAGRLAPSAALGSAAVAVLLALGLAGSVSPGCLAVIALYLGLTGAYSTSLKHQPILDVACVAAGFVLRAVGGAVAAGVTPSPWFLLVAGAASLFAVAGRRHAELALIEARDGVGDIRRSLDGYTIPFIRFLWTVAAATTVCGYSLWAVEEGQLRPHPGLYQLTVVPFVLAILRYALQIERGNGGTPEDIVLGDRALQIMGLAWAALFVLASELAF
jgi:decaprenyl-phosphate phosphoribosyltransferase